MPRSGVTVSNGYGARSEVEKTEIAPLSNSDTGKMTKMTKTETLSIEEDAGE